MKNYWLELSKQSYYWTAEFSKNGIFLLKPRKILCKSSTSNSRFSIIFSNYNPSDVELRDFITDMGYHGVKDVYMRLKRYKNVSDPIELEHFEITELSLLGVNFNTLGPTLDLEIDISFNKIKHHKN